MSKPAHEAFIKAAGSAAKKSEKQTCVPASVTVAQAILESGWGEAHMGHANNYFGIKAQVRNGKIEFVTDAQSANLLISLMKKNDLYKFNAK